MVVASRLFIVLLSAFTSAQRMKKPPSCDTSVSFLSCISIFAGRIADAGHDPLPILSGALARMRAYPQIELIWASPRELFNIVQAEDIGCHIITVTHDLLKKLPLMGRDLTEYSLDTVKMFVNDARAANFTLDTRAVVRL